MNRGTSIINAQKVRMIIPSIDPVSAVGNLYFHHRMMEVIRLGMTSGGGMGIALRIQKVPR